MNKISYVEARLLQAEKSGENAGLFTQEQLEYIAQQLCGAMGTSKGERFRKKINALPDHVRRQIVDYMRRSAEEKRRSAREKCERAKYIREG